MRSSAPRAEVSVNRCECRGPLFGVTESHAVDLGLNARTGGGKFGTAPDRRDAVPRRICAEQAPLRMSRGALHRRRLVSYGVKGGPMTDHLTDDLAAAVSDVAQRKLIEAELERRNAFLQLLQVVSVAANGAPTSLTQACRQPSMRSAARRGGRSGTSCSPPSKPTGHWSPPGSGASATVMRRPSCSTATSTCSSHLGSASPVASS